MTEILVALFIASISLLLGVPALGNLQAETRLRGHASELALTVAHARLRATERGFPVSVCPADSAGACRPGANWSRGWVVFDDPDGDGRPAPGTPSLHATRIDQGRARIAGGVGRASITFRADGSSAGSNVTLTLCDPEHRTQPRQVIVSNAGRARSARLPVGTACPIR